MSKTQPEINVDGTDAEGLHFAIVVSRWNSGFTEKLLTGAIEALERCGATKDAFEVFKVPGAFELPLATLKAAETGRFDAVVALGVVIRGDTPHFDFVAGEAASGIMQASLIAGVPIMFGVITADTEAQVVERCGEGPANKGFEAAMSAIETANLYREMDADQGIKVKEKTSSHVV